MCVLFKGEKKTETEREKGLLLLLQLLLLLLLDPLTHTILQKQIVQSIFVY